MHRFIQYWFTLALLITLIGLKAQPITFQTYSLSAGLPQSQVTCALSDSRGYLWFGTEGGGLCRFDGLSFEVFTVDEGLPSNFIRSIYQQGDYLIWIGTSKGLCRFDGRSFTCIPGADHSISTINWLQNNTLLVGTVQGLYKYITEPDSLISFAADTMGKVLCSFEDQNQFWYGTTTGLWTLNAKDPFPTHIIGYKGQGIYAIAGTGQEKIWFSSWGTGLHRFHLHTHEIDSSILDPLVHLTNALFQLNDSSLWIGTQNRGLVILDSGNMALTQISELDGLPHYNIKSFVRDASDNIWITTSGGGIAKCVRQNFRQFTRADGLRSNRVYDVHLTPNNQLWIATGNTGIQLMDSTGFRHFSFDTLIPNVKCKTITSDQKGRIWVGTEGQGVLMIDSSGTHLFNRKSGLPDDWVQTVDCDATGRIWIATYTGGLAYIMQDTQGLDVIRPFDLPVKRLTALLVDGQHRIFVGSADGRLFLLEAQGSTFSQSEISVPSKSAIQDLAFDAHGRLWIGTRSDGIFVGDIQSDNTRIGPFQNSGRLSSRTIYLLLADENGSIWAGTEKGVDQILFQSNGEVQEIRHFGWNEGFLGMETCHDAAVSGMDGTLWFGTLNGLMRYSPGDAVKSHRLPRLHFEAISLFYKPLEETNYAKWLSSQGTLSPGLILHHRENHISFRFKAVDLEFPDDIVYRWKLSGIDTAWSPSSRESSVSFAGLPPGEYTLEVQASVDEQQWTPSIQAAFAIAAPFWQKPFFPYLLILSCLILFGVIFFIWSRQLRKKESARREKLELQNRLLQLEQKALQLQMNPHFIFNALTGIKSLVTEDHLPRAREEINAFAKLMRGILNNSRKPAISLREEADVLHQYLHLEQLCHHHKFDFTIELPSGIDPDEVFIPPMLIQPFVENAVIHGVGLLSYPGTIKVGFEVKDELLRCIVVDNGPGREQAKRMREERKPGHQPVALEVTRERLEAIRDGRPYTSLTIEDIQGPDQKIHGTKVIVTLPVRMNW